MNKSKFAAGVRKVFGRGPKSTEYDVIKRTKKDNYTLLNRNALKNQTVLIGDSIIELFPVELFDCSERRVYNRGISGDTSDRLSERMEVNALNIEPSKIFILIGTNDLSHRVAKGTTLRNVAAIIDKCLAANVAEVYMSSILPVNKDVNRNAVNIRNNSDIAEQNAKIRALCEEKGVFYVDVHSAVCDGNGKLKEDLTFDGLHPNAKGFAVMYGVLEKLGF